MKMLTKAITNQIFKFGIVNFAKYSSARTIEARIHAYNKFFIGRTHKDKGNNKIYITKIYERDIKDFINYMLQEIPLLKETIADKLRKDKNDIQFIEEIYKLYLCNHDIFGVYPVSCDDTPIGFSSILPLKKEHCAMFSQYQKPKFCAIGIGTLVQEALIDRILSGGYNFCGLTEIKNTPALKVLDKTIQIFNNRADIKQTQKGMFIETIMIPKIIITEKDDIKSQILDKMQLSEKSFEDDTKTKDTNINKPQPTFSLANIYQKIQQFLSQK